MISVFVAESENHVRAALSLLIEYQPGMHLAGAVYDTEGLLAQVCRQAPDVILLDWNLPGITPRRLIRTLRECCPGTRLVATSVKPEHEQAAREWGVDGFLSKQIGPESFIAALESAIAKPNDSGTEYEDLLGQPPQ